eukprot:scaffold5338_cov124-Alexandrium_tamarense.AAC.1
MEKYLKSYRKEFAKAKSNGLVEEWDADPISSGLFRLICQWAVHELIWISIKTMACTAGVSIP